MISYRDKPGVSPALIHVYVDGRFSGKIRLVYPRHNDPRWQYLPLGKRRLAGEMFTSLSDCKRSLEDMAVQP